ncbi:MAG TPA: GDSL-type esterase/lipase family protein [Verrucomicrobiae bacterium]|jgi:lysophospholipase L1-like esterase|nr:GDSL-type esterase/lipase family protein [Verrucomicrobiae bacterium]
MKKQVLTALFVGAALCLGCFSSSAQIKILPYGDSVTSFGSAPESSYRYWLFVDLTNAGYVFDQDFVFVGTRSGTEDAPPQNNWPAEEYSGGEGQTSLDAANDGGSIANSTQPDVVLLDFGSNDFGNWDLGTTRTNLDTAIEAMRAVNPNVTILIAKPTPWIDTDPGARKFMTQLNGAIGKVVKDERRAGANIIAVNLFGGFNARQDTKDLVHPNVKGEQLIAKRYLQKLKTVLKRDGIKPQRRH